MRNTGSHNAPSSPRPTSLRYLSHLCSHLPQPIHSPTPFPIQKHLHKRLQIHIYKHKYNTSIPLSLIRSPPAPTAQENVNKRRTTQGGVIGVGGAGESSSNCSMSTVSRADVVEQHDYVGMTDVSSHPRETKRVEGEEDGSKLELGLGLGLSLGVGAKVKPCAWRDYCRILSAKDLSSFVSAPPNTAAASTARVAVAGTKRAAESDSVPQELGTNMSSNQVVGWPPIRAYRLNSLVNQAKGSVEQNIDGRTSPKKIVMKTSNIDGNSKNDKIPEKGGHGHSKFVKVNMDGVPIGRKVDLNAHICYETLAQALEDMFHKPTSTNAASRPSGFEEHEVTGEARRPSKLLDGSSELALTYEDREGDWMLVGDVPWGAFFSSSNVSREEQQAKKQAYLTETKENE